MISLNAKVKLCERKEQSGIIGDLNEKKNGLRAKRGKIQTWPYT